jgi:cellulose synthase operon protein C
MTKGVREPLLPVAPAKLADRGAEAMRLGRFKEAIEAFKQLVRRDPQPLWQERLSDAYVGRARTLVGKGMLKEAAVVLENTLTPDGTVREPALYLSCLIRQGQQQKAARIALKYVERDPMVVGAGLVAELAAALSLITPITPTTGASEWINMSRAAYAALGAWVQGKPPSEVESLLTHIPLHSPFGALRVILKCLVLPQDASTKAAELLKRIPVGSVLGGFRAAVEAALINDAGALLEQWTSLSREQQTFVAEIRGLPANATERLSQILAAERLGPGALFALLIRSGLPMPSDTLRVACLDLLPLVPGSMQQFERRFGPLSGLERNRALALSAEASDRRWEAQRHWEAVGANLSGPPGSEARLAQGVVLRHLADLAQRHPEVEAGAEQDAVAHYLERSLEADPDHLPATLSLIEHYRQSKNAQAWHPLAEQAVQRFPESSAILLHAMDAAVARNAYNKAAGLARRLLQMDPINRSVRQRMIELQLAQARKQMRASRAELAAKMLSRAAEWERGDSPNAALRIGQALVSYNDQDCAAALRLRQAVALAGGGTVGWFHAVLEAALMGWTEQHRQPLHRELAAAQAIEPRRDGILSLIALLSQQEIRDSKHAITSVLWRIDAWLLRGASLQWTTTEFETIAACLHYLDAFDTLAAYAREAIRRDPDAKAARFYRIVAQTNSDSDRLSETQAKRLFELLDDAHARDDFQLASQIRRLLEGAGAHHTAMMGGPSEEFGPLDMARLLDQATTGATPMPEKEVRKMVKEFGHSRTIEVLADLMIDSPLGDMLTDQEIALLCGALVTRAVEGQRGATQR